ncbi:MAG: PQQ-binding-like beta-propeller repeat protein, partial [Gemmataceae bacterium]
MFTARDLTIALMLLAGAAAPAWGQPVLTRIYSHPEIPPADVLRRLDLQFAWASAVPMDGKHDRLTYTLIDGNDLFVVSISGQVARINAETGLVIWRSRPSRSYTASPYLAVNLNSVYVIANATMFSLDRERGLVKWEYPIPGGLSAAPVVDGEQIYVPRSDSRLSAFTLPFVSLTADGTPGRSLIYSRFDPEAGASVRPTPRWEEMTDLELAYQPVLSTETVFAIAPSGRGKAYPKFPRSSGPSFRFEAGGKVSVPPGGYGSMALIGADSSNLYALDIDSGRLAWRFTAGTGITRRPIGLENDVYVTSDREGLARVNRATGEPLWRIPVGGGLYGANNEADQFLAASGRFVYALDPAGRLVVLDRRRGVTLARMEKTAYRVPIVNQVTDRLYLAANDGTIVCLHDREQVEPLRHRKKLEDAAAAILKLLEVTVDEKAGPPTALEDVLARLRSKYGIHHIYANELLKTAGMADLARKEVSPRLIEGKPLKDVYRTLLRQVNATYQVDGNTMLIVPEGKDKEPKEEKKDKEPKEDKDEKKDDKKDKDAE